MKTNIAILVSLLITGCHAPPHAADLVGTWREKIERAKTGSILIQTHRFFSNGNMTVTGTATTSTSRAEWSYEGTWRLAGGFLYTIENTSTWSGVQEKQNGTKQQLTPDFAIDLKRPNDGLRLSLVDSNTFEVRFPSRRTYIWNRVKE